MMLWQLRICFAVALLGQILAMTAFASDPPRMLVLLPSQIALSTVESRQLVVAQWKRSDQFEGQAVENLQFASSDESVVKIVAGYAVPVANGQARITARSGDSIAVAEITVTGQDQPFVWNFRNHVESVLSKQNCNGGACHGARAGQKGFRLTLFGFDVDADYSYLTRQALGRRVAPSDPGRSLILTKPTGLLPHKGGIRLEAGSAEYRVLAEWIAAGAPGPQANDPQILRLEVFPKYSIQSLNCSQQIVVLAHFSDGHVEDATRWAKYTSVNSSVASVGDRGEVKILGSGEGAVKVWYLNHNAMAFLTVPYPNNLAPDFLAHADRRNFIDELINEKLESLKLPPSPRCSDSVFVRRAFLDTIGTLPTGDETRNFLADLSTDKRERLIDQLLVRPEFVDYWSYKWSDLLLLSGERLRPKALSAFYASIRSSVAENKPWDQFARDIVTASGSTLENGAANFFALHQDPEDMAETVSQAFMGLSINCAKCHNHPLEKWTNDQYYGMANLFARVRSKGWGGDYRSGDGLRTIFSDVQGELIQPSRGTPQPPRPLDSQPIAFDARTDRRLVLADWLTSRENPYFTRAIVNRVWANFYGVGLVEKVDDLRVTNPASNEKLLDAAAKFLADNRFDLKLLMRAILQSAAYQRDSHALPENAADERFYSRYYPRRMKAEVLLDALSQVANVPTQFHYLNAEGKPGEAVAAKRALQLPDAFVDSYFLKTFGQPVRLITCECERSDEPSMTQVLHLYNGETLNKKLQAAGSAAEKAAAESDSGKIVEDLYLTALSRWPDENQKNKLVAELTASKPEERRAMIEDLYWSVLSTREFLFNH